MTTTTYIVDKLELAHMRGEAVEVGKDAYDRAIRQFFGHVPNRQERRSPEGKMADTNATVLTGESA